MFLDDMMIYRGYYTVAPRYKFNYRVVKMILYEREQRVKYCSHHEKIKSYLEALVPRVSALERVDCNVYCHT